MSLLEFFGETCPHCIEMIPLVEKMEKENKVNVEKFEVWNSDENAKKMEEYDTGLCGGVPFFYNTDSKKFLCGSSDYDALVAWAKGE
ncbi:MAG: thioredoxin family protein [Candidatus Uhrbacteria bacterium]|nr:thioredoxin family protein [Candidatus Uhrbacteria bacterium]